MDLDPKRVHLISMPSADYPQTAPYHPDEAYPEYPFSSEDIGGKNPVYAAVRDLFMAMQLDAANIGKPQWNPLGSLIQPGQRVLLKPNWVQDGHQSGGDVFAIITHGSFIRAVTDYVWIALQKKGDIIIADAPLHTADFQKIVAITGVPELRKLYKTRHGFDLTVTDLRREEAVKDARGIIVERQTQSGDPAGYVAVGMGARSMHKSPQTADGAAYRADYFDYRVTQYNPAEMRRHHGEGRHEYLIAGSVLQADVVIGLPKLKTHRKAGMSNALKNMVGINGNKDWLPHHTVGSRDEGGDEYLHRSWRKRLLSKINDLTESTTVVPIKKTLYWIWRTISLTRRIVPYPDPYFEGSWKGNDTLWRTILDLNRILFYADRQGTLQSATQRKLFYIVDGVHAGEGNGPLHATPKDCGLVMGGTNPVAIDAVATRLMGLRLEDLPVIAHAADTHPLPLADFKLADVQVQSNNPALAGAIDHLPSLKFQRPSGW